MRVTYFINLADLDICMCRRGQISSEYLILIGFATFIILGILGIAFFYTSGTNDQIRMSQLSSFAQKIISNSETVFYAGEPSKITFTAYLPAGVKNLTITPSEIIFSISTSSGVATTSFSSNVPLSGSLPISEGVKRMQVVAQLNDVAISQF